MKQPFSSPLLAPTGDNAQFIEKKVRQYLGEELQASLVEATGEGARKLTLPGMVAASLGRMQTVGLLTADSQVKLENELRQLEVACRTSPMEALAMLLRCGEAFARQTQTAPERLSPLQFVTGMLLWTQDRPADVVDVQRAFDRAGLQLQKLLAPPQKTPSYVYEPLGYGRDLCAVEATVPECPLYGQEDLLVDVAVRLQDQSVCLIGEPGVGKSAFVRGLAWHLTHPEVGGFVVPSMQHWRIVSLSRADLIAGASGRGTLEQRLKELLAHLAQHPEVILFCDEVHALLDARDVEGVMIINALKPALADARSRLRVIVATTDREYERHLKPDEALCSRFGPTFLVPETDEEATLRILRSVRRSLAVLPGGRRVEIDEDCLRFIVTLSNRYQRQDCQPRKSIDLLRLIISRKKYDQERVEGEPVPPVDRAYVLTLARVLWKIKLTNEEPGYWQGVLRAMTVAAPAQEDGALAVVSLLLRLSRGHGSMRPVGTPLVRLLVLHRGGQEALALERLLSVLRCQLFDDDRAGTREDMREFGTEISRLRLVGAPPGYLGFGETVTALSKIRSRSQGGVLHLAHFAPELPHPTVQTDLQALLSGTMRDSAGRPVDVSQWIIICSAQIPDSMEAAPEALAAAVFPASLAAQMDHLVLLAPEESASGSPGWESLLADWRARGLPLPGDEAGLREQFDDWAQRTGLPPDRFLDHYFQAAAECELAAIFSTQY